MVSGSAGPGGRGAGVGGGQAAEAWNIAGQLNDALVVDVVQHMMVVPPDGLGGRMSWSYIWVRPDEIQSGTILRRPAAAVRPVCR